MAHLSLRTQVGELIYQSRKTPEAILPFRELAVLFVTEGWVPPPGTLRFRLSFVPDKSQRQQMRTVLTEQMRDSGIFEGLDAMASVQFLSTPQETGKEKIHFIDLRLPPAFDVAKRDSLVQACQGWRLLQQKSLPDPLFVANEDVFKNITPRDIAVKVRCVPQSFYLPGSNFLMNYSGALGSTLSARSPIDNQPRASVFLSMYAIHKMTSAERQLTMTDEVLVHIRTAPGTTARQAAATWKGLHYFRSDGAMYTLPLSFAGNVPANDDSVKPASHPEASRRPRSQAPVTSNVGSSANELPHTGVNGGSSPANVKIIEHCPRCGFNKVTPPNGIFHPQPMGGQKTRLSRRNVNAMAAAGQYLPYADMLPQASTAPDVHPETLGTPQPDATSHHALQEEVAAAGATAFQADEKTSTRPGSPHRGGTPPGQDSDTAPDPVLYVNPAYFKWFYAQATEVEREGDGGAAASEAAMLDDVHLAPDVLHQAEVNGTTNSPLHGEQAVYNDAAHDRIPTIESKASNNLGSNGVDECVEQDSDEDSDTAAALQQAIYSSVQMAAKQIADSCVPAQSSCQAAAQAAQAHPERCVPIRQRQDSDPGTPPLPVTLPSQSLDTFIDADDEREDRCAAQAKKHYGMRTGHSDIWVNCNK